MSIIDSINPLDRVKLLFAQHGYVENSLNIIKRDGCECGLAYDMLAKEVEDRSFVNNKYSLKDVREALSLGVEEGSIIEKGITSFGDYGPNPKNTFLLSGDCYEECKGLLHEILKLDEEFKLF